MSFTVEKAVPVPSKGGARTSKYPWADMKVGDSFHVEGVPAAVEARLRNAYRSFTKGTEIKFTIRHTDTGARIWRTK